MYTMRLICLILLCVGTKMSYCMMITETNGRKTVILKSEDMKEIQRQIKNDGQFGLEDRFGSLIGGKSETAGNVQLAKHHIIPKGTIRSEMKKLANDNQFQAKLETYVNHVNNRECQKELLEWATDPNEAGDVAQYLLMVIIWNPNNLRAGPKNGRFDDPKNAVDNAVATKEEREIANPEDRRNILEKLTALRSNSNPTWKYTQGAMCPKNISCPWTVNRKEEITSVGVTVNGLVAQGKNDERIFIVETGEVK